MHPFNPKKFRRLVANRCRHCDRQFFYRRDNRPKFFCDGKCRQADFRHTRYLGSKRNESPKKTEAKSKTFGLDFADRPLNVLGGYKWYGGAVERQLWVEITATKPDSNPVTATKFIDQIPADLSIPPFLRRRPE